ncbi:MAG TPA: hypothetical protein VGG11_17345 [Xanthobacteraceae bacterium]
MRWGVLTAGALSVTFALGAVTTATAQSPQALPPLPGFVGPYEISRIVRSAGFDPLAPPLREGATYVVRAVDFRGTLMRVVVDGRSGAIRAVNRIVAASEAYGPTEMPPPPYGQPPSYAEPLPEFAPPGLVPPRQVPFEQSAVPNPPPPIPSMGMLLGTHSAVSGFPPLPRPRPAEFASRKAADEAKAAAGKADAASHSPAAAVPKKQTPTEPLPD